MFGQDGLTNTYTVDPRGNDRHAADRRGAGARLHHRELSRRRSPAKLRQGYIREPHVAVEVEAYRPFFILGEVTTPGQYPYVPNMTVETAVAIAGGFTPRASASTRSRSAGTIDGATARSPVPPTCRCAPATRSSSPNAGSEHVECPSDLRQR